MNKYKGIIFIILTTLCFSTQEISGKYLAIDHLNSFQINSLAFLIGCIILVPIALRDIKKRNIKLGGKDFAYFTLLGILQVALAMTLFQQALTYANPAIVAVITCANAIITIPVAQIILKEKFPAVSWLAILLATIGIIIIMNPFASGTAGHSTHDTIIGVVLALLGSLSMSFFNVFSTRVIKKYGSPVTNAFTFLSGVIVMFIFMLIFRIPIFTGISMHALGLLVYVGIVVKALGYLFFLAAMKETSAITATSVFYIKPIIVPILMFIIMGELITINVIIGTILIVIASVILYFIKKNKAKKAMGI